MNWKKKKQKKNDDTSLIISLPRLGTEKLG